MAFSEQTNINHMCVCVFICGGKEGGMGKEGGRKGEGGRGEHSSAKLSTAQHDMPCDFLLQINSVYMLCDFLHNN